jgi:hypothetical protein
MAFRLRVLVFGVGFMHLEDADAAGLEYLTPPQTMTTDKRGAYIATT